MLERDWVVNMRDKVFKDRKPHGFEPCKGQTDFIEQETLLIAQYWLFQEQISVFL